MRPKDIEEIFDKKSLRDKVVREKFRGVNLSPGNRVEFRYMGGPGYHKKFATIKQIIANYAFALSAACDPTFMEKEYVQRLSGVQRNLDAGITKIKLETVKSWAREWQNAIQARSTEEIMGVPPELFSLAIKVCKQLERQYQNLYNSYVAVIGTKHLPQVEAVINKFQASGMNISDRVSLDFEGIYVPFVKAKYPQYADGAKRATNVF